MSSDSDSDCPAPAPTEVVIKQIKKPKKALTQKQIDTLASNRAKALERLTELRRQKAEEKKEKEEEKKQKKELEAEVRKQTKEKLLNDAPKVKKLDEDYSALRRELEELRGMMYKRSAVEKVEEKVTEKKPEPLTGHQLLDKLFFSK
jgi:chromosome segregation ATPase